MRTIYKHVALIGATTAAVVGVGTAALATSGSSTTGGTSSSSASHQQSAHRLRRGAVLRRAVHGELVTHSKQGFVLHAAIRGTVTSIDSSAITVKAADGTSESFGVGKATKVREHTPGQRRGTSGSLSDVTTGKTVIVIGRKAEKASGNPMATVIVERK